MSQKLRKMFCVIIFSFTNLNCWVIGQNIKMVTAVTDWTTELVSKLVIKGLKDKHVNRGASFLNQF